MSGRTWNKGGTSRNCPSRGKGGPNTNESTQKTIQSVVRKVLEHCVGCYSRKREQTLGGAGGLGKESIVNEEKEGFDKQRVKKSSRRLIKQLPFL